MRPSISNLPWLVAAPEGTRRALRALSPEEAADALPRYAAMRLSAEESATFAKALGRCRAAGLVPKGLTPLRLGLLSNATIDLVADQLPAGAARHGVALELVIPPYDQVQQQALDSGSMINAGNLDAVLLAVDHRWLSLDGPALGAPQDAVDVAIGKIEMVVSALRKSSSATIILQTVPVPPLPLFGSFDRRAAGSQRALIAAYNDRLMDIAAAHEAVVFDVAALAERAGTDHWFDPIQWAAFKLPFSSDLIPAYADSLGSLLGALRGKSRKCLVLDLDNTVWGGVIGDDGMGGIKIGQGSAVGEAHVAVQAYALALRDRGIMLAVSSKNDDANARQPFREHPDMLLREEHITVFQANWMDKASNLESIARTINIGVDALVFLDDNPAERAQMRAALPMVAVPELPDDPTWYPWYLASAGYFEATSFSNEDRLRVESYASEAKRAQVLATSRDLGDYLQSLGMTFSATPFNPQGRARIAQLINKTNQFNLTTRRYTEAQVHAFETDAAGCTVQVRLKDSYGDFGMIGVIIARPPSQDDGMTTPAWEIDTWLMSCRVLGRKVEQAMLAHLVHRAREAGIARLIGVYRPTAKNGMVANHYGQLGFTERAPAGETDERVFDLDVASYVQPGLPFDLNQA